MFAELHDACNPFSPPVAQSTFNDNEQPTFINDPASPIDTCAVQNPPWSWATVSEFGPIVRRRLSSAPILSGNCIPVPHACTRTLGKTIGIPWKNAGAKMGHRRRRKLSVGWTLRQSLVSTNSLLPNLLIRVHDLPSVHGAEVQSRKTVTVHFRVNSYCCLPFPGLGMFN